MLYQEGWGVRGDQALADLQRRLSPRLRAQLGAGARATASCGFSPFTRAGGVAVAEAIPFAELTAGLARRGSTR